MSTTRLRPGEFRATCNLTKPHPISELPHYLRREYEEKGWKKGFREAVVKRDRRRVECFLEPLCEGHVFTDRAVFEDHMTKVHGRRRHTGEWETFSASIKRGWVSPRAGREDTPLKKAVAERVVTCDACGLVMERGETHAAELFVREHLERCTAQAGAA